MDDFLKEHFTTTIERDFFRMFCGDLIAQGSARTVYEHAQDPKLVVKIETASQSFQNVLEWNTWESVRETAHAKWFAPCIEISSCGIVLIQRKTSTRPHRRYPKKIPSFFTDTKYSNYGFIGKQFVCHDYGLHLMLEKGMTKRMSHVEWWDC